MNKVVVLVGLVLSLLGAIGGVIVAIAAPDLALD